ncbi:MAG: hypothetical protein KKE73_04695 [Proteobacteria bacterium]|nr:hypothetical protein [Pseudomonadota bacterium]
MDAVFKTHPYFIKNSGKWFIRVKSALDPDKFEIGGYSMCRQGYKEGVAYPPPAALPAQRDAVKKAPESQSFLLFLASGWTRCFSAESVGCFQVHQAEFLGS